ncbi:Aste57867_14549 [Aphanomyces stellatus]|uniref:Aste57867_14549 protein n=1 Tax=Aphanomyces stellatus TaxID=120398 RepID=A0A485L0Y8_9STRA|nr:hypothetical protein As57867_014495 [Aphanomyces stellatus]VFT91370.1 Aste57867_14549 [Aphanomyces stellatus]
MELAELSLISECFNAAEMNTRWKIHVLVVRPEGAVSDHTLQAQSVEFQDAIFREIRRQNQLQAEVLTAILPHKSDKSYTDGALGQLECARLKKQELIVDVAPIHDEEAFWSRIIQQQADAITNEAVFDAFITPFFDQALADCNMVFVNCERYQWLSQSTIVSKTTDLIPDGFATHPGMFRVKTEPNDGVNRPSDYTFRFGVAVEDLFDCLILF